MCLRPHLTTLSFLVQYIPFLIFEPVVGAGPGPAPTGCEVGGGWMGRGKIGRGEAAGKLLILRRFVHPRPLHPYKGCRFVLACYNIFIQDSGEVDMLQPGQIHGRYEIVSLLGQGGMGAVYRALDTLARPPRPVALKVAIFNNDADVSNPAVIQHGGGAVTRSHADPPTFEMQFKIEASLLYNLHHPNLPQVSDYFSEDDQYFLVMELVEGNDLAFIMDNNDLPIGEQDVLNWLRQVMEALEYCHQQNVLHRDIKPENIIVTPQGKVYLVDFGISYLLTDASQVAFPAATISFCPPEQLDPSEHFDVYSDIYALGATIYYLLTREMPTDAIERKKGVPLISPHQFNPSISLETESCILQAMELNPADRFASISEMRAALGISPVNSHDIFISFAHEDAEFVNSLCVDLETRNLSCWVASRDIPPDTTWPAAISEGISNAHAFLLILSRASNKSKQVAREVTMADTQGLPIFCLRIEDIKPSTELSYYLSNIQWIDSWGQPNEIILNKLADNLRNAVREHHKATSHA